MIRSLVIAALIATPALAVAQDNTPPKRIRNILLQAGETCPRSTADEIVVCSPADAEQFRIPKQFREAPKTDVQSTAWAVRVDRVMEDNQRVLPNSCSPIGTNGQSGCAQRAAEAWSAEKRAVANGQSVDPN
ncbi:hypothetical protein SAMN06297144_2155 [Sphingomonas guangdongensis]|uniref:Secreted protein n=1 Tax=Sphingomonas guangdongensis TaxID=1141890 RepID=A0A285QYI7_9SPHN|nr:hypothetical protein [Sphingomonas guangdongensis]SOB87035.1 hypothetical protein SAMN06297144_2155 [Sphingomonas guangdongensis]